ncbi:MAG: TIR domain-containing protein [Sphingomicrobium sp.]
MTGAAMASIFLSYARDDVTRARRVAEVLEKAGHLVWWDQHLHAGSRFSAEIDAALKKADLVVVLWSARSIESPWVQDEAGAGRDSDRLVPVLLDRVNPPLGFRQYHAIDLSRTRGRAAGMAAVVSAVEDRLSGRIADNRVHRRDRPRLDARIWIGMAAFLMVAGAIVWFLIGRGPDSARPSIVIESASATASPLAEMLARNIADELGRFRVGPLAGLDIRQPGGRTANYHTKVGVIESAGKLTLELSLASQGVDNLWSATLEGPSNQGAELDRQAAAMIGAALQCNLDLEKRHYSLTADVRVLYIDGCARLADPRSSRDEAIDAFSQVTQKAPRFAPGWAKLAFAEFSGIDYLEPSEKSNLAWTAGRHSTTARQLDPNLPEIYFVQAFDRPWIATASGDALQILDEGLHLNPDSALLHGGRADVLLRIGRIAESIESAKRATALNPLSPALLETQVLALTYAGQSRAAERELKTAESNWPRSVSIATLRYMFDLRYGDPANAERMLRENEAPGVTTDERTELFLQARIQPTEANIKAALRSYEEGYREHPWSILGYVQALAQFGRVEEAYRAIAAVPVDPWYANGDILFRPFMKKIRADPRFMQLAHRAGLVSLWKKTGVWPDFCRDPQLPYNCQKESSKYPDAST